MTIQQRQDIRNRAKEIAKLLAEEFKVPVPSIDFRRGYRGAYYRLANLIKLPAGYPGLRESTVIHEFAHHLTDIYYRRQRSNRWAAGGKAPVRPRPHGVEFRESLLMVARAWYGKPELYAWEREYPAVRAWAIKEKLTPPVKKLHGDVFTRFLRVNDMAMATNMLSKRQEVDNVKEHSL